MSGALVPGNPLATNRAAANQSAVSAPAGTLARALPPGAGAHAGRLLRAESTTAI
jgi:hypothetical protein